MSVERRQELVEPSHPSLSIVAQCRLLSISRSSWYYQPVPESEATLALRQVIDTVFLDCPWYGSRQMVRHLRRLGHEVGRHRVRRLMARMGLAALYSVPGPAILTPSTGYTLICCANWRSCGPTTAGVPT